MKEPRRFRNGRFWRKVKGKGGRVSNWMLMMTLVNFSILSAIFLMGYFLQNE